MKAWEIVTDVLQMLQRLTIPGANLMVLDQMAEKRIRELGGEPFNKGYKPDWAPTPFPTTLCTSINNEIVHGFPFTTVKRKVLEEGKEIEKEENIPTIVQDGDLINYDIGVKKDGVCGDAAFSMGVGKISPRDERLLRYAKHTLYEGIKVLRPGVTVGEVARRMETYAASMGYVTNMRFTGHGIGLEMHMLPLMLSYYTPGVIENDVVLQEGWMVCLEPQITYKDRWGAITPNGWTTITRDNQRSAFFEHQLLITKDGCETLTKHISLIEFLN